MVNIHHINCLKIISPLSGKEIIGHCLLLEEDGNLALVDTGTGLLDAQHPLERIGQPLIDIVGFRFDENITAVKQIKQLGLDPANVRNCIISHLDPDHIGGLADFPSATMHVSKEELINFQSGNPRYLPKQLDHHPTIKTYAEKSGDWFGLEARKIELTLGTEIYFIPLFGHTLGQCGVAIKQDANWIFYTADAYYLRVELTNVSHPINELAKMRADDNTLRIASIEKIRKLIKDNPGITIFGYHDMTEFKNFKR